MRRAQHPVAWRPLAVALALAASSAAWAQGGPDPTRLSLEELMSIEVSSAARKPQPLLDTATAMHVLNRDDIRRSGASTLPELLRLVPGVQVSRIDASRYAISIRGFASRYAGKLLVLQDGRALFSPLFNGTFWEAQDRVLDDIERIEVIRGPGGTMWGANAFNGVINIITRQAQDTQGTLVQTLAGSEESGVALQHGGALGENGHYRAWAKAGHHRALQQPDGQAAHDALHQRRAGFRIDRQPDARDRVTVQGEVHEVHADVIELATSLATPGAHFAPSTQVESGAHLLLRWERTVGPDHHWQLQAYVDRMRARTDALDMAVQTVDLEFQQRLRLNPAHELTWGAGLRHVNDRTRGSFTLSLDPAATHSQVHNAFVQDEIALGEAVHLTLGSKFEHNGTTGLETQPGARLHWRASPSDSFWAAVSRAVETPSRASQHSRVHFRVEPPGSPFNPTPFPIAVGLRGNPGVVSQELVAREFGYRGLFGPDLCVDLAVFHNRYDRLVAVEGLTGVPGQPTYGFANGLSGHAYGVELSGVWQVAPTWRLSGSVSTLRMKLGPHPNDSAFGKPGESPGHMVQLHAQHDLAHNLDFDAHLYRQGRLPFAAIPAHTRLDLRLGWRVRPGLELALTGHNLLQRRHTEFTAAHLQASDIPRSWSLQSHWRF
ncbi:TonB-dependent receptor domain-containing protein [Hydrogenophaga sp.]|uniref:TonB-dependent receptor plug domain-containing protein n=1 Tax=Hydrogenophaga sp. TaxID=1904254 RepID=UPI00286D8EB2|nr:TonB-dependent receptor [Hydrogenophaga sp.]